MKGETNASSEKRQPHSQEEKQGRREANERMDTKMVP